MSELNQGELLDVLDGVFSFYLGELGHEEDKVKIEQAKKQIKEMVQKSGCLHVDQVYKKIGLDGLPAAWNEQGNEGIYCKDCGIKIKEVC